MQRNRGAQGLSSEPQGISLGSPPCAPFKDSSRPSARSLGPHSRCNASIFPAFPHPRGLVRESIHPEKREPHGVCFRALGQAWFCPSPATRTPHNDQSRSSAGFFHKQMMPDGSPRDLLTHAEAFFAAVLRKQESMTTESLRCRRSAIPGRRRHSPGLRPFAQRSNLFRARDGKRYGLGQRIEK